MDREKLADDLTNQEDFRSLLYDDATGKNVVKGSVLQGNPTIGVGWNVAGRKCTPELARMILRYFITETWAELIDAAPWANSLPEPQARALCNMAFNTGVPVLMGFGTFLSLMQLGHYNEAAEDLAGTLWFRQVGSRGPKIQALIKEGIS